MREIIAHEAEKAGRSMNAEIVARLSFSMKTPPEIVEKLIEQADALDDEINVMEMDLRDQAKTIQELQKTCEKLNDLIERYREYERRMFLHVLFYIDEIPEDLAIWAYDMAHFPGHEANLLQRVKEGQISPTAAKTKIKRKRDSAREEAFRIIRQKLKGGEADV